MTPRHRRQPRAELRPVQPLIAHMGIWQELRRWISPQVGSQNQSRFPFRPDMPRDLLARAVQVRVQCVCGQMYHPVRFHKNATVPSLHVTGPRADGHGSCSYGNGASARVLWLQQDLGKVQAAPKDENQAVLF